MGRFLSDAKANLAKFKRKYKGLEVIPISAKDGIGIEDVVDKIHDVIFKDQK